MGKILKNEKITKSIEGFLEVLDLVSLTPDELAEKIVNMNESTRILMHIYLVENGKKELAKKIEIANKIICLKRINEFKNSVSNGTEEEYLSNILYIDKIFLEFDMGLSKFDIPKERELTNEEKRYHDILENAIKNDILEKEKEESEKLKITYVL
ncbi:MAG: hypothetical protein J6J17_01690 [Bacilli bacterium]|nr:hypothetical protein [Bacilli bacterium]